MEQAKYIEVQAGVRYWEDATVNGVEDGDGTLIPCRKDESWTPVIRLEDGQILDWPEGTEADIHYKVCDQGEYWLLDADKTRIAKWSGYYVPDDILCVGDQGYGDYIILKVGSDGRVQGWPTPRLTAGEWDVMPSDKNQGYGTASGAGRACDDEPVARGAPASIADNLRSIRMNYIEKGGRLFTSDEINEEVRKNRGDLP